MACVLRGARGRSSCSPSVGTPGVPAWALTPTPTRARSPHQIVRSANNSDDEEDLEEVILRRDMLRNELAERKRLLDCQQKADHAFATKCVEESRLLRGELVEQEAAQKRDDEEIAALRAVAEELSQEIAALRSWQKNLASDAGIAKPKVPDADARVVHRPFGGLFASAAAQDRSDVVSAGAVGAADFSDQNGFAMNQASADVDVADAANSPAAHAGNVDIAVSSRGRGVEAAAAAAEAEQRLASALEDRSRWEERLEARREYLVVREEALDTLEEEAATQEAALEADAEFFRSELQTVEQRIREVRQQDQESRQREAQLRRRVAVYDRAVATQERQSRRWFAWALYAAIFVEILWRFLLSDEPYLNGHS